MEETALARGLLTHTDSIEQLDQQPTDSRYRLRTGEDTVSPREGDSDDPETWYKRIEDSRATVTNVQVADDEPVYQIEVEYTLGVPRFLKPSSEIEMDVRITGELDEQYWDDIKDDHAERMDINDGSEEFYDTLSHVRDRLTW